MRAAILVPWAIPTAVSAILWGWIFNQDGIANVVLGQHIMWASGNASAKAAIIIADVWKTAPYIGLLTLAGLQVIPDEVYEAAKIDGANAWRRFTSITLPLVKPALAVAVLFRALDALRMFDLPYILIGARKSSVETISMLVQDEASNLRYGSAAAYALILFLYVFIFAFAFVRITGADLGASVERKRRRGGKLPASVFLPKRRPTSGPSPSPPSPLPPPPPPASGARHEHRNRHHLVPSGAGRRAEQEEDLVGRDLVHRRHRLHRHLLPGALLLDGRVVPADGQRDLREQLVAAPPLPGELRGGVLLQEQLRPGAGQLPHRVDRRHDRGAGGRDLRPPTRWPGSTSVARASCCSSCWPPRCSRSWRSSCRC